MLKLSGRKPVKKAELLIVCFFGLVVGCVLGYILMGTAHAVLEIGAEEHFQHGVARRWASGL